jgi:hypothetical protein
MEKEEPMKYSLRTLPWIASWAILSVAAVAISGRPGALVFSTLLVGCAWALWRVLRPHVLGHCPDCGVAPGETHDRGCDVEECPVCHRQLITCDCWEYHESDDADAEPPLPAGLVTAGRIPYGKEIRWSRLPTSQAPAPNPPKD